MKWALIVLLALSTATATYAQEFNAGFIKGLWFSSETVFADKPVRIYVAIRNNTGADLTGRVEFFDNDKLIGRTNVSALDGRIIESWADWTPKFGSHTIKATLSRTELSEVGSSTRSVEVTSALAEQVVYVDYDTDSDSVGNETDTDDDGDGLSDETEKRNGTDSLTYTKGKESDNQNNESGKDSETSKQNDEDETPTVTAPISGIRGLESYLTDSPARTALTGITNFAQTTKRTLDAYRTSRSEAKAETSPATAMAVNDSGFGEIVRSSSTPASTVADDKDTGGLIGKLIYWVGAGLNFIYSAALSGLSLYLGHPAVLQLTLLLLILFVMYKLARRFGDRPRKA